MEDKIRGIVAEQVGIEESAIKEGSTFEDLGVDSLDMVEIIMTVEEEFDIDLEIAEADDIKTFGQFVEKVKELQ
jgi:acyl carrier protein